MTYHLFNFNCLLKVFIMFWKCCMLQDSNLQPAYQKQKKGKIWTRFYCQNECLHSLLRYTGCLQYKIYLEIIELAETIFSNYWQILEVPFEKKTSVGHTTLNTLYNVWKKYWSRTLETTFGNKTISKCVVSFVTEIECYK